MPISWRDCVPTASAASADVDLGALNVAEAKDTAVEEGVAA
jgi:hypothetical protein